MLSVAQPVGVMDCDASVSLADGDSATSPALLVEEPSLVSPSASAWVSVEEPAAGSPAEDTEAPLVRPAASEATVDSVLEPGSLEPVALEELASCGVTPAGKPAAGRLGSRTST